MVRVGRVIFEIRKRTVLFSSETSQRSPPTPTSFPSLVNKKRTGIVATYPSIFAFEWDRLNVELANVFCSTG